MQEQQVQKVEYVSYTDLSKPSSESISQGGINLALQSKEWFIQFQALTNLRQANKYYSKLFIKELLPVNYKYIIAQVDNLRSNNSKEALTLLAEVVQFQELQLIPAEIIQPLVAAMIGKSVSEKGFLKNQAMKGLNLLPNRWSESVLEQLCVHTQAINGQISQLAIQLIEEMLQNKKDWFVDGKFLKSLSGNLNGKRAVIQKKARQILKIIKNRQGQEQLEVKINSSTQLLEEQSNTLRKELKQKEEKAKGPSLKQFLKSKKQQV